MKAPSLQPGAPWLPLRHFFLAEALAAATADRRTEKFPASIEQLGCDEQIGLLCREHWFAESLWQQLELIEFFAQRSGLHAFVRRERGDKQFAFADDEGSWLSIGLDARQAFEWLRENNLDSESGSYGGQDRASSLS